MLRRSLVCVLVALGILTVSGCLFPDNPAGGQTAAGGPPPAATPTPAPVTPLPTAPPTPTPTPNGDDGHPLRGEIRYQTGSSLVFRLYDVTRKYPTDQSLLDYVAENMDFVSTVDGRRLEVPMETVHVPYTPRGSIFYSLRLTPEVLERASDKGQVEVAVSLRERFSGQLWTPPVVASTYVHYRWVNLREARVRQFSCSIPISMAAAPSTVLFQFEVAVGPWPPFLQVEFDGPPDQPGTLAAAPTSSPRTTSCSAGAPGASPSRTAPTSAP